MLMDLFRGGGFMMWPMLFIGIGLVALTVRAALQVRSDRGGEAVERRLTSILFWGTMALVLGVLGTLVGFIQMGSVIQVRGAETVTVWGGITVALITLGFGLLLFILAMGCWYGLRYFADRERFA